VEKDRTLQPYLAATLAPAVSPTPAPARGDAVERHWPVARGTRRAGSRSCQLALRHSPRRGWMPVGGSVAGTHGAHVAVGAAEATAGRPGNEGFRPHLDFLQGRLRDCARPQGRGGGVSTPARHRSCLCLVASRPPFVFPPPSKSSFAGCFPTTPQTDRRPSCADALPDGAAPGSPSSRCRRPVAADPAPNKFRWSFGAACGLRQPSVAPTLYLHRSPCLCLLVLHRSSFSRSLFVLAAASRRPDDSSPLAGQVVGDSYLRPTGLFRRWTPCRVLSELGGNIPTRPMS